MGNAQQQKRISNPYLQTLHSSDFMAEILEVTTGIIYSQQESKPWIEKVDLLLHIGRNPSTPYELPCPIG
ncbi:MAG: hypothetical protein WBQ25_05775 [Nitrososphaeraceae archaeon]